MYYIRHIYVVLTNMSFCGPSLTRAGLVLARHDDAAKEWGALGARALVPSTITYEPKINSRTVQEERTGARARQEGGEADGGTDTVGWTVNGASRLIALKLSN